MVKNMAVISGIDVINIIVVDTDVPFHPGEGLELVDIGPDCEIGGTYADGKFKRAE